VTDRTKALLINSPSNPTGAIFDDGDMEKISEIALDRNLVVISDEVYEKFIYSTEKNEHHISLASLPEMRERCVTVNSFSKTYAMTGWRLGYAASNEQVIEAMTKISTATNSCVSTISQYAALEALEGPQDSIQKMIEVFRRRRDLMVKGLNQIGGISCSTPAGAFYVFPDVGKTEMASFDLSMRILEEAHVATVPGVAFGPRGEGHLRIAYTNSEEKIEQGLNRIAAILD
jgi:aspartate/methionine/tyrosine aminotransferase